MLSAGLNFGTIINDMMINTIITTPIKWIFNQYAYEGMGYTKIASELNRQKLPSQKGGTWASSTIRAIIFNESYIGRRCWNKQDYQTKGKKWRDRSDWVITENAHPVIIPEELFNRCQEMAKKRHNGGGETHKPYDRKPSSSFWLRGTLTCDKCGTRMVGNSTSSKMKGGRRRYYVCGGYLRKGKGYCPYVGWNKERVEEIVVARLRIAFMRLLMNDTLEMELKQYFNEHNQHKLALKKNIENETEFLIKRIQLIERDINSGKAKPYHHDMLVEMQNELKEKSEELLRLTSDWEDFQVSEEYLAATKYNLQAFLGLLDQEVPNVQLLHTIAIKYIPRLTIHRDTGKVYITLQLTDNEKIMYEKTLVIEWR